MKRIKEIGVIGGGTSGLIAALILKTRFPKFKIDVIRSDKIGIIGVGEGSTEHWMEFCTFCEITREELVRETNATFKYGVMFDGWTKEKYIHNVNQIRHLKYGQYLGGYAYLCINKTKSIDYVGQAYFKNKVYTTESPNQFHFDTFKLNSFLSRKCKNKNIKIIEDTITKVQIKNNTILSVDGFKQHTYDFYIDCTGFKKLLIFKMGGKWQSWKKYLPMNEVITFTTSDTKEYAPYTLSKAMDAGWLWRIPTYGRWGNGYVYDNTYINSGEAKKECEKYLKHKIEIGKNIKFDAGALEKPWIGNCVAIGLSSSFIEPLEASSIGTSIQQTFLLMHLIVNYEQTDIDLYNKKFQLITENIRDFVLLHYLVNKKESNFWRSLNLTLPDSLKNNLKKWKYRLPLEEDFAGKYLLFTEPNFCVILKELNLINKSALKKEYNMLGKPVQLDIKNRFKTLKDVLSLTSQSVSHKQMLREAFYNK